MVSLMQCLRHRPTWNRKSCLSGEAATFQLKLWQLALLIRKFCTNNSESTECCRCCCGMSVVLACFCSKYQSSPQLVLTQRSAVDLANQITCVTVGQIEYTVSRHHMYWLRIFRSSFSDFIGRYKNVSRYRTMQAHSSTEHQTKWSMQKERKIFLRLVKLRECQQESEVLRSPATSRY